MPFCTHKADLLKMTFTCPDGRVSSESPYVPDVIYNTKTGHAFLEGSGERYNPKTTMIKVKIPNWF